MDRSACTVQSSAEERDASMSDTSVSKKSGTTKNASQNISRDDKLAMLQACLNKVDAMRGIKVTRTTIFDAGNEQAAIVIVGCTWDDAGNLIITE